LFTFVQLKLNIDNLLPQAICKPLAFIKNLTLEYEAAIKKILKHLDLWAGRRHSLLLAHATWMPANHSPPAISPERLDTFINPHRSYEWWENINMLQGTITALTTGHMRMNSHRKFLMNIDYTHHPPCFSNCLYLSPGCFRLGNAYAYLILYTYVLIRILK